MLSFFRIAQNSIGLADVLEFFFSRRIIRISVGVILQGQFTVGLFYLLRIGVLLNSQDLVIIICHSYTNRLKKFDYNLFIADEFVKAMRLS